MMVVVTVESPRGRTTLAVPDDVPVDQLVPALAEACRCEGEASRWSLRARGEAPLTPELTLEQAGLYQGAVLELTAEQSPAGRRARRPHLASWAEVGIYHARRAGADAWLGAARSLSRRSPAASSPSRPGELDQAITSAPLLPGLLVAVLATEHGAGATTVAALLGTLLARLRSEPVTAVDADTASGSLGLCLTPGRRAPAADLLSAVAQGSGAGALRKQLVVERHGLMVLPAPILAEGGAMLDQPFYTALLAQLSRSVKLVVADCGIAEQPGGRSALASADLGVVVCRAEDADSRRLEQSLQAARASCSSVAVVVNRVRRSRSSRGALSQGALLQGPEHTLSLSYEPAAAARLRAAAFGWETAPESWQSEVRALASTLVASRAAQASRWAAAATAE